MMVNLKSTRTICFLLLILKCAGILIPGMLWIRSAGAFEFSVQAAGGYDDNVPMTDDASGSGFGLYRIGLSKRIYRSDDGLNSRLYLDGTYQDYSRFSDNYSIRAGGSTDRALSDTLRPGLYYEVMVYRDSEFPYDDVNEFLLGGRLEWLAAAAWTIDVDQSFVFQDGEMENNDLDAATAGGVIMIRHGRYGMGGRPATGGGTGAGGGAGALTSASGDGFLSRSSAGITAHPAPTFDIGVRLMVNRRWASGQGDAYLEPGFAVLSAWRPEIMRFGDGFRIQPRWQLLLEYRKAGYVEDGPDGDRDDTIRFAAVRLVLPFDPLELYAEGKWVDVDSTSAMESYRKGVIQCGISWYF